MNVYDLNPHIRYARVHSTYICIKKEISKCYDCRIFFFSGVEGTINANNIKYNIYNNTAIYLPPGTEYAFNIESEGKVIILDFDLIYSYHHITAPIGTATKATFDIALMPKYELPQELSSPIIKTMPQIARMLSSCADNFIIKEPFYRESSSALLKICLIGFVKQYKELSPSPLCHDVISFIHENYHDTELTNEGIAEKFNYHPYHLSRIIKQETGKTLHQYLIYYRLEMAKNALLTTQSDISNIAWQCGFNSPAYFTKLFKSYIHMTPKEYRNLKVHTEI